MRVCMQVSDVCMCCVRLCMYASVHTCVCICVCAGMGVCVCLCVVSVCDGRVHAALTTEHHCVLWHREEHFVIQAQKQRGIDILTEKVF